ncbi:DUF6388 family protein [Caballeronia sp. HLA56]
MSEPLLSKEQVEDGYERFVAQHPDVRARIEALTLEIADALGTDLGELRRVEVAHAMEEFAAREGIESFEYLLRYAISSASERAQILESRRESIERIIGIR